MKNSKKYKRLFIFSFLAAFILSPIGLVALNALTSTPQWDYDPENNSYTTQEIVGTGIKYDLPNSQSAITFTVLPEAAEKITFKQVDIAETGIVGQKGYEISTPMPNGTFEYNLEIPFGEGNNMLREVYFADSIETISSSTKVPVSQLQKVGNKIVISGLDHFTVFYVSEIAVTPGVACIATGATFSNGCFGSIQDAINSSSSGDEIRIAAGTYSENITIDKPLSLVCANNGRSPNSYVRNPETIIQSATSNPTDSAVRITSSDVAINGCLIDSNGAGFGITNNSSGYVAGLANLNFANNIIQNSTSVAIDLQSSPALASLNNSFTQNLIQNSGTGINLEQNVLAYVEYNKTENVSEAFNLSNYGVNPGSEIQIKNNNFNSTNSGVKFENMLTSAPSIIFTANNINGNGSGVGYSHKNIQGNINVNFNSNNISNHAVGIYLWSVNPDSITEINSSNFTNNTTGILVTNEDSSSGVATIPTSIILDAVTITGSSQNSIKINDSTASDASNKLQVSLINSSKLVNSPTGILVEGSDVELTSSATLFEQITGNYININSNTFGDFLSTDLDLLDSKFEGYTGNQMSDFLRDRTDSRIIDKLDNGSKGQVVYYNQSAVADSPAAITFVKPANNQFIKGTYEFQVKITDDFGIGSYSLSIYSPSGATLVTTCAFDTKSGVTLGKDLNVKCTLDTKTALIDGEYMLRMDVTDPENNTNSSILFNVDNTNPNITFESHSTGDSVCSMSTFDFSGIIQDLPPSNLPIVTSDIDYATIRFVGPVNFGPVNVNLVGPFWSYITNPASLTGGVYSIILEAYDIAGNKGSLTVTGIKINNLDCPNPILSLDDIEIDEIISSIPSEVILINNQDISYSCINSSTGLALAIIDLQIPANDSSKIVVMECYGSNTYSGKDVTSTYEIRINNVSPIINLSPSSINGNEIGVFNITASITGGNAPLGNIIWSDACSSFVGNNGNLGPLAPGSYTCTASITDLDGDTAEDTINIEIQNDIPDVGMAYVMSSANEPSNVTLSANVIGGDAFPSAPFFEYYWGGSCSTFGIGDAFGTLTGLTDGNYNCTLYVIDSDSDISNNSTVNFTVLNIVPTVSINPSSLTVDQGTNVNLAANVANVNAPFSYSWTGACSGFGNSQTGQVLNPAVGNYSCNVIVTDADGDVSNTATASFTVNAVSTTPTNLIPQAFIAASPSTTVTVPQTITLTAIGIGGDQPYRSYNWFGACSGSGVSTVVPSAPGTYICGVNITDANGDVSQNPQRTLQVVVLAQNPTSGSSTPAPVATTPPQPTTPNVVDANEESNIGVNENNGSVNGSSTNTTGSVLGIQSCTTKIKLSGFVYAGQDSNGVKDSNENGIGEVLVSVLYNDENNQMQMLTSVRTSSAGYWEANGCPANYEIRVDKSSVLVGYELTSSETLRVVGRLTDISNINFELKYLNNIDLSIIAMLFIGGAFVLFLLLLIFRKKDKKEDQVAQTHSGIGSYVQYQNQGQY